MVQTFTKVGLEALLTPENCVLLLIDHQPFQLADVRELQRDWARTERLGEVAQILFDDAGASGSVLAWEMQLLGAPQFKGA